MARIEHDLAVKTNSLDLENACMSSREKLVACGDTSELDGALDDLASGVENLQTEETLDKEPAPDTAHDVDVTRSANLASFQVRKENPFLQSTYNTDFEQSSTQRSTDLQRTMGAKELEFA